MLHHVAERIGLIQIFWQIVSGENMADALVGQDLVETAERSFGQAVGDVPGSKLVLATVFLRVTDDGVSQVAKLFLCPDVNLSVSAVLVSIRPGEQDAAVESSSLPSWGWGHLLAMVLFVGGSFKKEGRAGNIPFILAIRFEWLCQRAFHILFVDGPGESSHILVFFHHLENDGFSVHDPFC